MCASKSNRLTIVLLASIWTACVGFIAVHPRSMYRPHVFSSKPGRFPRVPTGRTRLASRMFHLEDPAAHNFTCPTTFVRESLRVFAETNNNGESDELMLSTMLDTVTTHPNAHTHQKDPLFEYIDRRSPVAVSQSLPGVYLLGMADIETYTSLAWFIRRPGGNVMVDVPLFDEKTADELARMGGVQMLVVTHKDSAGNYQKWLERFPGCKCIAHRLEGLQPVHYRLERAGPWRVADDLEIFANPGHTPGSISVLYRSDVESVLFAGDHIVQPRQKHAHPMSLWGSLDNECPSFMHANSIRSLLERRFTWVLPGHGQPIRMNDPLAMKLRLEQIAFEIDNGEGLEQHDTKGGDDDLDIEALLNSPTYDDGFDPELEGLPSNSTQPDNLDKSDEHTESAESSELIDPETSNIERVTVQDDGPISFQ